MNKNHVSHLIDDYIDGNLNAEEKNKVEQHLNVCSQCQKEISKIGSVVRDLHQLPQNIEPSDKLKKAIDSKLLQYSLNHHTHQHKSTRVWNLYQPKLIMRIAAGFIVFIGAGILTWLFLHNTADIEKITVQKIETSFPIDSVHKKTQNTIAKNNKPKMSFEPISLENINRDSALAVNAETQQKQPTTTKSLAATAINDTSNQIKIMKQQTSIGQISGKVVDSLTGDPLIGANIILEGTSIGTAADINGEYQFKNVPDGIYNVKVSYMGYKPTTIGSVSVKSNLSQQLVFQLQPQQIECEAVVVMAQVRGQNMAINQQLSSNAISSGRIQELPDASSAVSIGRLPGVSMTGGDKVVIRGLNGEMLSSESCPPFNTEEYNKVDENEFKDALSNPLSTFSIDVDAASYSNIRRFINNGQLPPPDAVRIEEMINYFKYDYPQPSNRHPFSVNTEVSVCPWNPDNSLLLVGLQGKSLDAEKLSPSNFVFLLDVSGSMNDSHKLPLVKAAVQVLVRQLRPQDRVAIVVYAGNAGLVLPSTSGNEKEKILEALDKLQAGGSTAGGEGIKLAYKTARENFLKDGNNRVILATDGDFNVGISSEGELMRLIEEERKDNIFLSVLGFGMGNYKDSKMEKLADRGNGNYAYIDDIQEARKVLGEQMAGTLYAIAKDVKIQIEFNPAIVKSYRLIGYENRLLNKEDFKDDKKDAGELGSGHTVTALYEIVLNNQVTDVRNADPLKYQTILVKPESFRADELSTVKLRYKLPKDTTSILITKPVKRSTEHVKDASRNFQFASAVAMFGMILRESKQKGSANYDLVLEIAKGSKGLDTEGYNTEFVKLVEACQLLDNRKNR